MLTPRLQGVGAYNAGDLQRAIQQFKAAAPSKGVLSVSECLSLADRCAEEGGYDGASTHVLSTFDPRKYHSLTERRLDLDRTCTCSH